MRLSKEEIENIKESVKSIDDKAKIILFGSRKDDSKKGGDIDLLIISEKIDRKGIWKIRDNFFEKFGEQKIDILIDDGKLEDPFKKKAFDDGIILYE